MRSKCPGGSFAMDTKLLLFAMHLMCFHFANVMGDIEDLMEMPVMNPSGKYLLNFLLNCLLIMKYLSSKKLDCSA